MAAAPEQLLVDLDKRRPVERAPRSSASASELARKSPWLGPISFSLWPPALLFLHGRLECGNRFIDAPAPKDIACRGWDATPADLLALAELLLVDLDERRPAS